MIKLKLISAVVLAFPAISLAHELGNLFAECAVVYTVIKIGKERAGDIKSAENVAQRITYSFEISGRLLGEQQRGLAMADYARIWKIPDPNNSVLAKNYAKNLRDKFDICEVLLKKI